MRKEQEEEGGGGEGEREFTTPFLPCVLCTKTEMRSQRVLEVMNTIKRGNVNTYTKTHQTKRIHIYKYEWE